MGYLRNTNRIKKVKNILFNVALAVLNGGGRIEIKICTFLGVFNPHPPPPHPPPQSTYFYDFVSSHEYSRRETHELRNLCIAMTLKGRCHAILNVGCFPKRAPNKLISNFSENSRIQQLQNTKSTLRKDFY